MFEKYIHSLTLITIFAIGTITTESTIAALKKILREINTQDDHKIVLHHESGDPRHYKHGQSKHLRDPGNLMNIQTMNLFLKPNKRQREENDVKRMLRTDEERMCKITGRCGCTREGCNMPEDDVADEIDQTVNDIWKNNKGLDNVEDKELKSYKNLDELDDNKQVRDDHYDEVLKGNRDDAVEDLEHHTKCTGPKCFIERDNAGNKFNDLLKNKMFKINDNVDLLILDESDLESLVGSKASDNLSKIDVAAKNTDVKSAPKITPEDLFGQYEAFKRHLISKVSDYIKTDQKTLDVDHLTQRQKTKLRSIKLIYKLGLLGDGYVDKEIARIIFGEGSNMKIALQTNNNDHVYIPKWLYDKIIALKRTLRNNKEQVNSNLYSTKRILPLTSQQKERMSNKKGKTIPKLVWRKNLAHDIERFGVPFDLDIHGLGQMST